ncbi:MotA/TolQ/ExbB proton channel family protein [Olivibacter sp. SDN3]|nr:MotA/TolQ/ExbB proton channel family protein [Olivibacter sp. SDN3]
MVIWTFVSIGTFLRASFGHHRSRHKLVNTFFTSNADKITTILSDNRDADIRLTELIRDWEKKQNHQLDYIRFLIKTGPSLGLIGTLIPMGKALSSLSDGDMGAMSGNMLTAFTSTIIGLLCGTVAYLISLQREKWLQADFLRCEAQAEILLRDAMEAEKVRGKSIPV